MVEPNLTIGVDAISTLGTRAKTFPYYLLGFIIMSGAFFYVASKFPRRSTVDRSFRKGLIVTAILLLGVLATPFTVNLPLFIAHIVATVALLITSATMSVQNIKRHHNDRLAYVLIAFQVIGLILLTLSLGEVGVLNILGIGQLVFMGAFLGLVTRIVYISEKEPLTK